jgi:hypothetical protein
VTLQITFVSSMSDAEIEVIVDEAVRELQRAGAIVQCVRIAIYDTAETAISWIRSLEAGA